MRELFFVRHGQTEWNAIGRMQGQLDSELSDLGRDQADVSGRLLGGLDIEAIFASPLVRTRQTAAIVRRYVDLPITYDARIMEWDAGDWSGHLYSDIETQWRDDWLAFRSDPFRNSGPGAETIGDMVTRSNPFLEELRAHPARRIAVIAHGFIGRVMVSTLMGFDELQSLSFHQSNDTIIVVTLDDAGPRLHHYVAGDGPREGLPSD